MKREVRTENMVAVLIDREGRNIRDIYDDRANDGLLVITDNEAIWDRIKGSDNSNSNGKRKW